MAAGGELIIDNKLLKLLDSVDKKLEKVAKSSGRAQDHISKMFNKVNVRNVDGIIQKLRLLEKKYSTIGQNDSRGMKRIANDARKTADEINKLIAAVQQRWTPNFKGAMNYSQNAQTLSQDREAINRLRQARENLSRADSEYFKKLSQINAAIAVHSSKLRAATGASHEMRKAHSGLMDISGQLTRKLALVFSVSQVQGYVNKLSSVRAEFEMQQKSLQVLLRDKDEANKLWNQTIQLAVQSPFRVKELVTYTKQLAAYRIETEKLHDTTNMLADVSVGLGVDMNRLILAFGQVRAAEFLRGTELRQFTEAGIPMLEELADHFTELEGRAVSTADVFARISKRMVTFEDVEQVFKKVTSEGGTFYRMQEEQSRTLYGMISNLHDSIDLMMNDIGQSNESVLKGAVELTKTLVDNWRAVASVMEVVGTSLAIKGLTLFVRGFRAASAHALLATTNFRGLALAGAKVNGAMKAIHATLMAHPWYAVAAAVLIATKGLYDYNKSIQQHNKKYDDLSKLELSRIDRLKEIREEVEKNNATIKDSKSKQEELNQAQLANAKVLEELKKKFPDLYDGLVQQKNGTIELSDAIEAQNALLQINIALQQASKGGWFQQDMETNYTQVYEAQKKMEDSLGKIKIAASNVRLELLNMLREKSVPQNIASPIQKLVEEIGDSEDLDYATSKWKELSIYLQSIYAQGYRLGNLKWDLGGAFVSAHKSIIGYDNALKDLYDNLDNGMVRFKEGVEWALSMGGNEAATKWLNTMLMSLGIVDEKIKKEAREYITSKINIKLEFGDDKKEYTEDDLKEEWKKKVWNAIKAVQEANPEIALGITLKTMVEGDKSSIIPKLQESVKNAIDATTKDLKGADLDGQVVFTDDQMDKMEKSIPLLENLANLIALVRDTKGSGGDKKDWFAEMGRAIRDTHKDFHTLHKDLDVASATYFALAKNADVFDEAAKNAGVNMSLSDFEDLIKEESVLDALDALLQSIPESASVSRLAIKKMIGEITGDDAVRDMQETAEKLNSQIENMFGTYELSLELKDMNIPTDIAEKLFGFKTLDLEGLREELEKRAPEFIGTDREKEYRDYLQKVAKMEKEAQQKRLKEYVAFARGAIGERAKVKMAEMQKLEDIEKAFEIKDSDNEETKATKKQWRLQAIEKARQEANDAIKKLDWEAFKSSDTFNMVFDDLDRAGQESLENMIDKLKEFRNQWKDMPFDQMRQVTDLLQKAEEAYYSTSSPFAEARRLRQAIKEDGRTEEQALLDLSSAESELVTLDNIIAKIQQFQQVKDGLASQGTLATEDVALYNQYLSQSVVFYNQIVDGLSNESALRATINNLAFQNNLTEEKIIDLLVEQGKLTKDEAAKAKKRITDADRLKQKYQEQATAIGQMQQMANDLYDSFYGLATNVTEFFGSEISETGKIFAEAGQEMMNTVFATLELQKGLKAANEGATDFEKSLNSAMGIIGWIVMAVQIISKVFSVFTQLHDNKLQEQIENITDKVETLRKAFERLEKQMDEAYQIDTINDVAKRGQENLEQQIESTRKMIALEREKKDTDEDKIKEWQDEIEDANEKLKELEIERRQALGGLGGQADYKSASEAFVDAWLTAFRETGDGMQGLEEQYDEMMTNMIKKQLTTRVADKVLASFYSYFDSMFDETSKGGARVTEDELRRLEQLKEDALMQMNDQLSALSTVFGKDMMGQIELGTLQKGIQGITEQQADILASYLNTIRFFVAEQNSYLQDIAMAQGVSQRENPMVEHLKVVAEQTTAIHELLDNLLVPHPTQSGRGLKVVI